MPARAWRICWRRRTTRRRSGILTAAVRLRPATRPAISTTAWLLQNRANFARRRRKLKQPFNLSPATPQPTTCWVVFVKTPARWRKAHLDLGAALLSRDRSAAIQQSGSRRRTATLPYSARRLRRCLKPAAAPSDSTPCLFAKQSQCRQEARDCSAASRRSTTHRNRSAALGTVPAGSADKAVVLQNKAITTLRIDIIARGRCSARPGFPMLVQRISGDFVSG